MNRDDIIRMAREAGGTVMQPYDYGARPDRLIMPYESLERLAALVATAEREACAKVCEDTEVVQYRWGVEMYDHGSATLRNAAEAIRARGQA